MKSKNILSIITTSEKRKGILFLLVKKPMTLTDFKMYFGVTSPELIPRLKELQNSNLIYKENNIYYINSLGKMAVQKLQSLIVTINIIDSIQKFIIEHDLDSIPDQFQYRFEELGECQVITSDIEDITCLYRKILENSLNSKYIMIITPLFDPFFPQFFDIAAKNTIPVSIVLTKKISEKMITNLKLQSLENINMNYYNIDIRLSIIITDSNFSLFLCDKNGSLDVYNYLFCNNMSALSWAKELFRYYMDRSNKVLIKY
jgi:predicted transcriptional regulator